MSAEYLKKHCPQFGLLTEAEQDSVLTVIEHGTAYGFGNMMAWLLTAWNLKLMPVMPALSDGEIPMPSCQTTSYDILIPAKP